MNIKLFLKIIKIKKQNKNECKNFLWSFIFISRSGSKEKIEYKKIIGSFLIKDKMNIEKV